MKIGVPKEIKTNENRIALVPAGAETLIGAGHSVLLETGAGLGSGFPDEAYTAVGASIAPDAATVWRDSDMIMKVKEPIERGMEAHALRPAGVHLFPPSRPTSS
jgi:alanine dehydrogenase